MWDTAGLLRVNNHRKIHIMLFINVLSCTVWCRISYSLNAVIYSVSCVPDDSWSVNAQMCSRQVSSRLNSKPVHSFGVMVMLMSNNITTV
jgi:hypothetical protein